MLRVLIDDITLFDIAFISLQVYFNEGAVSKEVIQSILQLHYRRDISNLIIIILIFKREIKKIIYYFQIKFKFKKDLSKLNKILLLLINNINDLVHHTHMI